MPFSITVSVSSDCADDARSELTRGLHPPGTAGVWLQGQGDETFDVTELARPGWASGGVVQETSEIAASADRSD